MLDLFALGPNSFQSIGDARAMSPEEIERYQIANLHGMRQAERGPDYWRGLLNVYRPDPIPLDERFADFKKRLAAAIERRRH